MEGRLIPITVLIERRAGEQVHMNFLPPVSDLTLIEASVYYDADGYLKSDYAAEPETLWTNVGKATEIVSDTIMWSCPDCGAKAPFVIGQTTNFAHAEGCKYQYDNVDTCLVCGKEVPPGPDFCSAACQAKWENKYPQKNLACLCEVPDADVFPGLHSKDCPAYKGSGSARGMSLTL